jgi:uncharacterized spore protein YtfJ
MEKSDLGGLLEAVSKELGSIFNSKTVVGDPIVIDGRTIVPLVAIGFGTGLGAGKGSDRKNGEGGGSALGLGGGIRPVALLISDANGIRIESIKSGAASAAEHFADALSKVMGDKKAEATPQSDRAE